MGRAGVMGGSICRTTPPTLKGWTAQPYNSRWLPRVQPRLERVAEDLSCTATRAVHRSGSPPGGSGYSNPGVRSRSRGRGMSVRIVLLTRRSATPPAWLQPARSVKKQPPSRVVTGGPRDMASSYFCLVIMPAHLHGPMSDAYSAALY